MRLPTRLGFVLWVGCACCLPALLAEDAKPQKDAKDDSKRLQGSWKVVALETDGKEAPPEELKGMRWSFKGSELQIADSGEKSDEKSGGKSSVKLDSSKTPKYIDLVVADGPQKGKTMQGIFKFEKDRLVVCLRGLEDAKQGRPKEFMTEADSALGMITLERIKEYCWLHFGPKAEVRVLVRLDGEAVTLKHYAAGKPTARKEQFADQTKYPSAAHGRDVSIKDPDGKTAYLITNLSVVRAGKPATLFADVDIKGPVSYRQYCYAEMVTDPDKAPTAHFHGPLTIQAESINWGEPLRDLALLRGATPMHLRAFVGTMDRKKGCWVLVRSGVDAGPSKKYPDFPKGIHPIVEIEFSPKRPGDEPVKRRYELDDFC
jgi:uncharacterized protein (TIGR03067 family)